ncbi:hypothetical protein NPIL_239021, partial [Nephila pilipes]
MMILNVRVLSGSVHEKKSDSHHLSFDLRQINKKINLDRSPLPHNDDIIGSVENSKVFAKQDLKIVFLSGSG